MGERREMLNISTSVAVKRAAKLWYFMITAGLPIPPRDRTGTIIPCSNFFPIKDTCIRSKVPPAWLQRARRIFDETDRGMPSQKKLCIAPMRHSTSILSTLSWTNRSPGSDITMSNVASLVHVQLVNWYFSSEIPGAYISDHIANK